MHACGHDVHMTVAIGLLSYFSEKQPKDNLLFFFQPAEESESGGKLAYEKGYFKESLNQMSYMVCMIILNYLLAVSVAEWVLCLLEPPK